MLKKYNEKKGAFIALHEAWYIKFRDGASDYRVENLKVEKV